MRKQVIGYIRVSTGHQAESGLGLSDQRQKIEAYCELYDLDLIEVIADEGCSGRSLKGRDGLNSLIERSLLGGFDGIVIAKLDRLTRSVRDLQTILDGLLSNVELHSVSEKIDTSSSTGRLILNVLTSVASWEAEVAGERTSAALNEKKRQAQTKESAEAKEQGRAARRVAVNGRPPFGYRWEAGKLVEVEAEQDILNTIKLLRESGLTYARIAEELGKSGHLTKRGGRWRAGSVRDILVRSMETA
jgi:DNA invertase Pin-like site-specific DNA recombinase